MISNFRIATKDMTPLALQISGMCSDCNIRCKIWKKYNYIFDSFLSFFFFRLLEVHFYMIFYRHFYNKEYVHIDSPVTNQLISDVFALFIFQANLK